MGEALSRVEAYPLPVLDHVFWEAAMNVSASRAVEALARSHAELSQDEASLIDVVDRPLLLLDQDRWILWRNGRSLEPALRDVLPANAPRFTLQDREADRSLAEFLAAVLASENWKETVIRASSGAELALAARRRNSVLLEAPSTVRRQSGTFVVLRHRPTAVQPSEPMPTFSLSPIERRLVAHLAAGRTVREASKELGISYHTGRKYLQNVFVKTGARRQAELVALICRRSEKL